MNYDEMSYEDLEEELETKLRELKEARISLEYLRETINHIEEIEYDGADTIRVNLENEYEALDEIKRFLVLDIEEIQDNMRILEDMYDDRSEREHEYWADQF